MIRTTQSGLNLLVPPKSLYPSNQGYAASKFWGENTRKCHIWIVKVSYSSHLFRNDHSAMKERSRKINCWEKKNLDTASENAHFWFLFRTKRVKFCCFVGPSACFGLMPSQTDVGGLTQTRREAPVPPCDIMKVSRTAGLGARSKEESDGLSSSLTGRRRWALC